MYKPFISLCALCILFSCTRTHFENVYDTQTIVSDSLYKVKYWHIVGPFYADTSLSYFDRHHADPLPQWTSETALVSDFRAVAQSICQADTSIHQYQGNVPMHDFDFITKLAPKNPAVAYAYCEIENKQACDMVLAFNIYEYGSLWLNDEKIYSTSWKRGHTKFRAELVPIHLKKGKNKIALKVSYVDWNYKTERWRFTCDIITIAKARQLYVDQYWNSFMRKSLLSKNEDLELYLGPFANDTVKVIISDTHTVYLTQLGKATPQSETITISHTKLPSGLNSCELIIRKDTLQQLFYNGDIDDAYQRLKTSYHSYRNTLSQKDQLLMDCMAYRLDANLSKRRTGHDNLREYWDRIRVPEFAIFEKNISDRKVSQFHQQAFISAFSKTPQYYSIYLPTNHSRVLPVFINTVFETTNEQSWNDNFNSIFSETLDNHAYLANRCGFIPVCTNFGGGSNPQKLQSNLQDLVHQIKNLFPESPIYLIGNCGSTQLAIDLCNKFPDMFSGLGLINPLPLSNIQCPQLPIYVVTSYYDEEIPFGKTADFVKQLQLILLNNYSKLQIVFSKYLTKVPTILPHLHTLKAYILIL